MDELGLLHQGGVFLRREALDLGYDDRDLSNALRSGRLVRLRHGAYVARSTHEALDPIDRHLLRARAVVLSHPGEIALSHASGAAVHGLRLWGTDLTKVHVVRLGGQSSRRLGDVVHHARGWAREDVVEIDGLPVLAAASCAAGVAMTSTVESGMVSVDSAYHLGAASVDDMASAFERMHRWPGARRLQITFRLAEPGSQSVGESRLRYLCFVGHLPKPVLQFEVRDRSGRLIGVTDMAWPERHLLGEFDGKVKFGKFLREGESPVDAVFREKVREDRLREATGWSMIRFVWADLERRSETLSRLRSGLFAPARTF